jgi:hypothetical protein
MAKRVSVTSVTPAIKVKATSKAKQASTRKLVGTIAALTPVGRGVKIAATAAKGAKAAKAAKDAKIVASSPYLKQTPNMTLKQAKGMKQGTKELAKVTKKISKASNKRKSDNVTVGDFNNFLKQMGLDKPKEFKSSGGMKALDTPPLNYKVNAPSNITLKQVNKASALDEAEKAKAYAAAYRQAKREIKAMKKNMKSK